MLPRRRAVAAVHRQRPHLPPAMRPPRSRRAAHRRLRRRHRSCGQHRFCQAGPSPHPAASAADAATGSGGPLPWPRLERDRVRHRQWPHLPPAMRPGGPAHPRGACHAAGGSLWDEYAPDAVSTSPSRSGRRSVAGTPGGSDVPSRTTHLRRPHAARDPDRPWPPLPRRRAPPHTTQMQ